LKAEGVESYPHKFEVSSSIPAYVAAYSALTVGEEKKDAVVGLAGTCT